MLSERSVGEQMTRVLHARRRPRSLVRDRTLLEEKRRQICAVALALFLKDGFHGATTRAIARQAGIIEPCIS